MSQVFTNNATALTAANLEIAHLTVTLAGGFGALFPSPTGGNFFKCTIQNTAGDLEILRCTSRTGDVLTVQRAQENTSAQQFLSGSRVECRLTAETFDSFLQKTGGVMTGELDIDDNVLRDAIITDGQIRNAPIRGTDGGTSNQIVVPTGGGAPTIGGNVVWHAGNDGAASSLDADMLDGNEGSFYTAYASNASNLASGTVAVGLLPADAALDTQKNGWTAGEFTTTVPITATASTTIDANLSNTFNLFMDVNVTTLTVSNFSDGQVLTILCRQDAGGETMAFPGGWKWVNQQVPVLSVTAARADLLTLANIGGTVYANLLKNF